MAQSSFGLEYNFKWCSFLPTKLHMNKRGPNGWELFLINQFQYKWTCEFQAKKIWTPHFREKDLLTSGFREENL